MAESFFDTLSDEEKREIAKTTDTLAELLKEWVPQYPIIRPTRIPMAALSTALAFATAIPRLPPADYLPLSKMTLWIFGVDDITDERLITLADIQRKAEEWYWIAHHGASDRRETSDCIELTTILLEIREKLSNSRLFEPLCEQWASSLQDVLAGIIQEYKYGQNYTAAGADALPSLDEYLHYGRCSIGVPLWGLTVLVILGDPSAKENFESASEAIRYAGAAIRLYNDLKSFDKEIQEGNINSIVIRYYALREKNPSVTEASILSEAKRYVLQLADSYAQKCYDLTGRLQVGSKQFQEAISRTVAFHAYFYREHDYHITSLAKITEMLGGRPA